MCKIITAILVNSPNLRYSFASRRYSTTLSRTLHPLDVGRSSSFPPSLPFLHITHGTFASFHQFSSERPRALVVRFFLYTDTRTNFHWSVALPLVQGSVTLQFFFSLSLSSLFFSILIPRGIIALSLSPLISTKGMGGAVKRTRITAARTIHTVCSVIAVRSRLSLSLFISVSLLPSVRASFTFCRGSLGNGAPAILPLKRADDGGAAQFRLSSSHYCPSPFTVRSLPTAMQVSSSRRASFSSNVRHPPYALVVLINYGLHLSNSELRADTMSISLALTTRYSKIYSYTSHVLILIPRIHILHFNYDFRDILSS